MKTPKSIRYADWGYFIQMDKKSWDIIKQWLEENGKKVIEQTKPIKPRCTEYGIVRKGKRVT